MRRFLLRLLSVLVLVSGAALGRPAAELRCGVARIDITPAGPIWMAGYAARSHASEGAIHPLWAKALALEDRAGHRAIIVTSDVIGLPREVTDEVAARAMQKYSLERSALVLNSSHTHTGPVIRGNLSVMGAQTPEQKRVVDAYIAELKGKLLTAIGAALGDLQPASLAFAQGEAGFAANRRQTTPRGVVIGLNPGGPVDHSVPVLRVAAPNGRLRALLFGYACHNTTLTAEFYHLSGDYAGFAQAEIERQMPGVTALFMQLCGADQNPEPRSRLELAEQHGRTLAAEVLRVARGPMPPVGGRLSTVYSTASLAFAPHTREQFERERQDGNRFQARRAELMLAAYDERREPRQLLYPLSVVRFSRGFTLVALGGEVVVDYSLWLKQAYPTEPLMVAGYSNDVACYIPSARVLKEGGYEAEESMIYYAQPGPFTVEVESRIQEAIGESLRRAGK